MDKTLPSLTMKVKTTVTLDPLASKSSFEYQSPTRMLADGAVVTLGAVVVIFMELCLCLGYFLC